jgi:hypothetical protein
MLPTAWPLAERREIMKRFILPILLLVLSGAAQAQSWIVFVPAERDFRVLLPEPPSRNYLADGSHVFTSRVDREEYDITFSVYRLPARISEPVNARAVIEKRVRARRDEERRAVVYVRDEEDDGPWERYLFRQGGLISVHRLAGHAGRYYELEVLVPRGSPAMAVRTARDFFNSFQVTGAGLPPAGTIVQRIETWCQGRKDSFSHAFCQYSVCLQPGYEKYPHCSVLTGLRDFF